MNLRSALLAGLAVGAMACTDATRQALSPDNQGTSLSNAATRVSAGAREAELLARAIAAAMRSPAIRSSVRDAMRASLLTEHKLGFQDFISTRVGKAMLVEAGKAGGRPLAEIERLAAAMPPADFYVPAEQHRLSWKGTGDLIVAAMLTPKTPTIAYRPEGSTVSLDFGRRPGDYPALFLLQYAETKNRRVGPQPNRPGHTIQDPGDGKISGLEPVVGADGRVEMKQVADVVTKEELDRPIIPNQTCNPDVNPGCGGGGGGGGTPQPSTYLTRLKTVDVQDGTPWEANEFEFRAVYRNGSETRRLDPWPRREGVEKSQTIYPNLKVVDRIPYLGSYIDVTIVETDIGTNDWYYHVQTDNIVKVYDYRKGYDFPCWRNGYEGDFPARNTVYARFSW